MYNNNMQFNYLIIFLLKSKRFPKLFCLGSAIKINTIIIMQLGGIQFIHCLGRSYPWWSVGPSYSLGRRDLFFISCKLCFFPYSRLSCFFCFFVLFHSCCSHARLFGKTLVNEYHISYIHTEWYLFFLDSATTSAPLVYSETVRSRRNCRT